MSSRKESSSGEEWQEGTKGWGGEGEGGPGNGKDFGAEEALRCGRPPPTSRASIMAMPLLAPSRVDGNARALEKSAHGGEKVVMHPLKCISQLWSKGCLCG